MTLSALVTRVRGEILDDAVAPYLWSDPDLTAFANEAIVEACKRAPLLVGATTIDITAGVADCVLGATVLQILEARLDSQTNPLSHTTADALMLGVGASWQSRTGTPTQFIRRGRAITLYPIPLLDDTLLIQSTLLPGASFAFDTDIDTQYQHGLMYYIAYKAYLKRDADTYNPGLAKENLSAFDAFFGLPKSAKWHRAAQDMPMNATILGGRMA